MADTGTNTILLNIMQTMGEIQKDIGEINGRLAIGSERHRDFARSLDALNVRGDAMQIEVAKIAPLVDTVIDMKAGFDLVAPLTASVTDMKPKVKTLMDFRGKMGGILLAASTIVGGAFWLAAEGVKFFAPDIRALFSRFFH